MVDFVLLCEPGLLSYHNRICSQFIYYKVTCKLSTYQNIICKTPSNSFFIYFIYNTTFHNNQSPSSNSNLLIYMPIDSSKPTKKCNSCKINELLLRIRRRRSTDPKQQIVRHDTPHAESKDIKHVKHCGCIGKSSSQIN